MEVVLYRNTSETNAVEKSLTEIKTEQGTLKNSVELAELSIVFNFFSEWKDFDYIYIPDFGRYYFVRSKRLVNKSLVGVSCVVDVLMSFKETISENILTLSESDKYIEGGRCDYEGKNESILANSYDFEDVFDGDSGVLIAVKGV